MPVGDAGHRGRTNVRTIGTCRKTKEYKMKMSNAERQRLLRSDLGNRVSEFFGNALRDARDLPGRSQLRAEIAERFEGYPVDPDELEKAFVMFAKKAQRGSGGPSRFELRGHVFELAIQTAWKYEKDDRLLEVDEPTPEEVRAAIDASEDWGDKVGRKIREEEEADAALEVLRKAGQ